MKQYKYRVMSWAFVPDNKDRRYWPEGELREVKRRHFKNVEKMNEYVFMEQLLGRTVEVMDMEQFYENYPDQPDAILTYYRLMNHNRIEDARRFLRGEIDTELHFALEDRPGSVGLGRLRTALKKMMGGNTLCIEPKGVDSYTAVEFQL
jgi:hypothetical protein